ncbi:hypothetical protein [Microcoleus sp. FACHB-672]|uniref:hypothetical protein n=1 Tax=Microcoleus sp. FACHB-672 TaxID=2692825 RepID=UPI0016863178|nr:hypothetical protein [Microcoleus sp. FACHB-672]MBD2040302.1 hypothetical protein [Microcoleus sp. FACHB-672]
MRNAGNSGCTETAARGHHALAVMGEGVKILNLSPQAFAYRRHAAGEDTQCWLPVIGQDKLFNSYKLC